MPKRIMITDYPVEYAPFNPPLNACFYGSPENSDLPDSNIPSMHYHSSFQLGICLNGNGVFLIENEIYAVKEGDTVIIAPDVIHCSRGMKNCSCNWDFVYFDPFEMKNRYPELVLPSSAVFTKENDAELNSLIEKIIDEGRSIKSDADALSSMYFFTLSMLQSRKKFSMKLSDEKMTLDSADPQDLYNIMPAIKEIAFRFDESLAVAELSGICRLSESHFTRIFKKCVGMSPYNYTLKFRTRVGAALLRTTTKNVNDISSEVGFGSPSDFYRQFTKYYSCSPSDYRNGFTE